MIDNFWVVIRIVIKEPFFNLPSVALMDLVSFRSKPSKQEGCVAVSTFSGD
jgi:hypothetical protein